MSKLSAMLFALLGAAIEGCDSSTHLDDPAEMAELAVDELVASADACGLSGREAGTWALSAQQRARARWERVWFAPEEAPRAVRDVRLAIDCYRASRERERRATAEAELAKYLMDLQRRYRRARFDLSLALRAGDLDRILEHSDELRALLALSGGAAAPEREQLARIHRAAQAARFASARHGEPAP